MAFVTPSDACQQNGHGIMQCLPKPPISNPNPVVFIPLFGWGHAAFVVNFVGGRIVIDRFLANRVSALSSVGPRQFIPSPFGIQKPSPIDTLVVSHNHHDQLYWHAQNNCRIVRPLRRSALKL